MNTNSQEEQAQLCNDDGEAATLRSVHIEGRLDGLLLQLKSRQRYRNDGKNNLETVYTFPLPRGATLLGLNAEIDGHRLQGTVLEKKQATERYEKAIDAGDTPIMVERSASGLYTANLGNLKPGESAVIEIEYAQLLRFEQGQIRITVPTTVAPRYGDAHRSGGLARHESVEASLLVDYPLTLQLTLAGQAAQSNVQSPSHKVELQKLADTVRVSLKQDAFLDRDFVLLLQGLQGKSFSTVTPDGEHYAVLASYCPALPEKSAEPLMLKVLVDCSGSMGGDSIQAARKALHEVLKELTPEDWIGYSRFGSSVVHDLAGTRPCDGATVNKVSQLIAATEADLGGTEMNAALLSTFELGAQRGWKSLFAVSPERAPQQDVLLITDGDIWDVEEVIRSAKSSGHRVFAVGVGSAPAESLLRELAEKTGGACELVSPNQDVAQVILRTFRRMRATRSCDLAIEWGQEPVWQSPLPKSLFTGDTVHVFARLARAPNWTPMLSWAGGPERVHLAAAELEGAAGDTLARMGAAAQLASMSVGLPKSVTPELEALRLDLALRYQLVSEQTNLLLVHVRADGSKSEGLPAVAPVQHMQAAGWGGVGAVSACMPAFSNKLVSFNVPSVWRTSRAMAAPLDDPFLLQCSDDSDRDDDLSRDSYEDAAYLRKGRVVTPLALLEAFDALAQLNGAEFLFADRLDAQRLPVSLTGLLNELSKALGSRAQAWALVLQWLQGQLSDEFDFSRIGARVLRYALKPVDAANQAQGTKQVAARLARVTSGAWGRAVATVVKERGAGNGKFAPATTQDLDDFEIPAFLRKGAD
jgi:Ca-activated chloride channel family protein